MRYSPFRHLPAVIKKDRSLHCTVFLTRRCNASCPFCFYLSDKKRNKPADKELTLAELESLSGSMGRLLWLAFSGGEIFLRQDLEEVAALFYRNNRPAIILLPTNGLQPETICRKVTTIIKTCHKSTVVVKLSLDGPAEIHNQLRGVKNGFALVWESFKRLELLAKSHSNLELGFNTVLTAANQDVMDRTLALVQDLAPTLTHTVSLVRGAVADPDLLRVEPQKYYHVAEQLAVRQKTGVSGRYRFVGAGMKAAQDILQRRRIHQVMCRQMRDFDCQAGQLSLTVSEQGDVFPCEDFGMNMGNLRQHDFNLSALLSAPQAQRILKDIKERKCCCTHECYHMLNIFFTPAVFPELAKEYIRLLIKEFTRKVWKKRSWTATARRGCKALYRRP